MDEPAAKRKIVAGKLYSATECLAFAQAEMQKGQHNNAQVWLNIARAVAEQESIKRHQRARELLGGEPVAKSA